MRPNQLSRTSQGSILKIVSSFLPITVNRKLESTGCVGHWPEALGEGHTHVCFVAGTRSSASKASLACGRTGTSRQELKLASTVR